MNKTLLSRWISFKSYEYSYIQPSMNICTTTASDVKILIENRKHEYLIIIQMTNELNEFQNSVHLALADQKLNLRVLDGFMFINSKTCPIVFDICMEKLALTDTPWSATCRIALSAVRVTRPIGGGGGGSDECNVKYNVLQLLVTEDGPNSNILKCLFSKKEEDQVESQAIN